MLAQRKTGSFLSRSFAASCISRVIGLSDRQK
jgi:hypothetical protein